MISLLSEETDLTGIRQVTKSTGILQHLDVGLGCFGTGQGKFLNGQKLLALSAADNIKRRIFTQAANCHKGRAQLAVFDHKVQGIALVNINGQKFKAPQEVFIGLLLKFWRSVWIHYPSATACVSYNPARCEKPHSKTEQNDSVPFYDIAHGQQHSRELRKEPGLIGS